MFSEKGTWTRSGWLLRGGDLNGARESTFQEQEAVSGVLLLLSWAMLLSSQLLQSFLLVALLFASDVKAALPLVSPCCKFSRSLFLSCVCCGGGP